MKMQGLDHPNVMTLLGICVNVNSVPCIIMPYMANGSLLSYIRGQKETLVLPEVADKTQVCYNNTCKRYVCMFLYTGQLCCLFCVFQ